MIRFVRATLLFALLVTVAGCARQAEAPSERAPDTPAATASVTPVSHVPDGASHESSHPSVAGAQPGKPMSLREAYPDYKPGADDPEAEAAVRGYRTVPVRDRTFESGGAASLADLVQMVATGIDLGDGVLLDRSAVNFDDFQAILWPEFPQSRPAAGVPINEAWDFLRRRHLASFNRTTGEYHGKGLKVASIKVGNVVNYTNFKLHDEMEVTLVDAAGDPIQFDMIRTVVECRGRFKLYSTRD
ncbi:MAG: hypothetical protein FD129_301 [bacterium]|nr:MAG: hypothetical protein FD129_301 [bacterium]